MSFNEKLRMIALDQNSRGKGRLQYSRLVTYALATGVALYTLFSIFGHSSRPRTSDFTSASAYTPVGWKYNASRDANNIGMTDEQCNIAFPKLYKPIDDFLAHLGRKIHLSDTMGDVHWGECRAMIVDNELYVVDDWPDAIADNRKYATLHAIKRAMNAIATTGYKFPNIEFSLAYQDRSADLSRPNWAYDRFVTDPLTVLMPDFAYYSWPAHNVGTYSEVRKRIQEVEKGVAFEDKIPKLAWRGTLGFGSTIRESLVNASRDHPWSAVEELKWGSEDFKAHMLTMDEHCKFQFLAQTEGLAYSGRLKYLHNCESVIIAHEFEFETHDQHLMISHGPEQNYVQVQRDFSDLPEKMEYLLAHPEEAARIARNNIVTFRDRYLTSAAEACYWRRLINEWGRNSDFEPEFYKEVDGQLQWRGVPYESFALERGMHWNEQKVG